MTMIESEKFLAHSISYAVRLFSMIVEYPSICISLKRSPTNKLLSGKFLQISWNINTSLCHPIGIHMCTYSRCHHKSPIYLGMSDIEYKNKYKE